MGLTFETVSCDLCGSERQAKIMSGHDRLLGLPGSFQFVRCLDCGLIRQNPRLTPSALDLYYPESYPSFAQAVESGKNALRRLDHRYGQLKKVRIVKRLCRQGRLLDVGCGTGNFIFEMSRVKSWQALGADPSRYACDYARRVLGVDVICGTLGEGALASDAFDVVTMWNTLEHVRDPTQNLRQAHRVLRPDGFLIFSVPVVGSLLERWFGQYWVEWDLPRHMFVFSPQTVEKLLHRTGFRLQAITSLFGEYRVFRMSLESWAGERISSDRVCRAIGALLRFLPVRLVGTCALRVAVPASKNSVLVFVCQKEQWNESAL